MTSNTPVPPADPHSEWLRQVYRLRIESNSGLAEAEFDAAFDEECTLEDRLAETPAQTLEGVIAQLHLALDYLELAGLEGDCADVALRNAVKALYSLP